MTASGRLQQRPWRGVAAGAAVVFCLALAYVAGRVEGDADAGAPPAAAPAESQPQGGDESGFGDEFQAPADQSQGEPPVTQAS